MSSSLKHRDDDDDDDGNNDDDNDCPSPLQVVLHLMGSGVASAVKKPGARFSKNLRKNPKLSVRFS